MTDSSGHDPGSVDRPSGGARLAVRIGLIALTLWGPFLLSLPFSRRMARAAEDLWLWPGLVPAYLFTDEIYARGPAAAVTLGHFAAACLIARWSLPAGLAWALFFALASWARLQALLAI
jgi:hypothetical protein